MLKIYLCEDNEKQRSMIEENIKNIIMIEELDMKIALSTGNPEIVLDEIQESKNTGIFFLDIDLKHEMNGLILAQNIRKYDPRCFIIFITTHSEMSYMTFSYKVEAMDFIMKDNPQEMKNRIYQCLLNANQLFVSAHNTLQKKYSVRVQDRLITINCEDILYFETSTNFHKVFLHAHNRLIEFNAKLKDIEEQLDDRFYRCHRSYIVNRDNIDKINFSEGTIKMNNGETCLASTRLIKGLLNC